jgi:hypothetical protein
LTYRRVGTLTPEYRDQLLSEIGEWKHTYKLGKKDYWSDVIDGTRMYLMIKAGGRLHPHTDDGTRPKIHWVLQSNPGCMSRSGSEWFNLEELGIYVMDPKVEHESINEGITDRIHLVFS